MADATIERVKATLSSASRKALLLVLVLCLSVNCLAATIGWDAAPWATGYKLYVGTASGAYETVIDAGNALSNRVDLVQGRQYFFAVTAYNAVGESDKSDELSFTPLAPLLVTVETSDQISGPWQTIFSATVTNSGGQRFFRTRIR
jgi:hypothetical protein